MLLINYYLFFLHYYAYAETNNEYWTLNYVKPKTSARWVIIITADCAILLTTTNHSLCIKVIEKMNKIYKVENINLNNSNLELFSDQCLGCSKRTQSSCPTSCQEMIDDLYSKCDGITLPDGYYYDQVKKYRYIHKRNIYLIFFIIFAICRSYTLQAIGTMKM